MGKRLTRVEIDSFREHGFLPGIDVFSEAECDAFRSRVDAFNQARPEAVRWAFDIKTNLLFDWVYELSRDSRLLDAIEDLIGPDVLLTNSIFHIKEPGSATFYGWHQDAARIRVEPGFVLAFVAISEATPENGCLRVIPESQHEVRPFSLVRYADRQVARVREVDESRAVDLVLVRGQVDLVHCNTVHGSGPNRSSERRIGLINDYTPPSARQSTGMGSGQLARGEDRWGHFVAEPAPTGVCTREDVLARRRILSSYPENVLMGPLGPDGVISFADEPVSGRQGRRSINRAARITRPSRRCRDMMLPDDRHISPVIGAGMFIRGIAVDRPSGYGSRPSRTGNPGWIPRPRITPASWARQSARFLAVRWAHNVGATASSPSSRYASASGRESIQSSRAKS